MDRSVTDWPAEVAKREQAIDGYLNDADPGRAEKYGFRSGQNPQLAWNWFRDNPVGFNGVPFVLFKTILDLDPNHANPTLRDDRAHLEARSDRAAGAGAPGLDVRPHRHRAQSRRLRGRRGPPRAERQSPLPFGFAFENPRSFEPLSAAETTVLRRPAAGPPRLPEHQPAGRQAAHRRQRGELGEGSAGLRQPRLAGSRVLLVRAPATSAA